MRKWLGRLLAGVVLLAAGLAIADTSTTNLLLTNQTTGGNPNTWGDIADTNFETIDNKIGDVQLISTSGGDTTLTSTQEIVNVLNVTGTLSSNATLTFSGRGGTWLIRNATTGDYTVTALVSGQTGVQIPQSTTKLVYCCISSDIAGVTQPSAKAAGEVFDTAATTCPDDSLAAYGQAISRTTYADLFAAIGTTYGVGDGSTTFNVPDLRGRVTAGQDDMGGTSANRLTAAVSDGINGDTLGEADGLETETIATAELPSHTHSFSATSGAGSAHTHGAGSFAVGTTITNGTTVIRGTDAINYADTGSGHTDFESTTSDTLSLASGTVSGTSSSESSHTHSVSGTSGSAGSGTAINQLQPTIILNKCIYTGV